MTSRVAHAALLSWLACAAAADEAAGLPAAVPTLWVPEVSLRTYSGFRDNVLLSSVTPLGSPLAGLAADASWLGLSPGGNQYTLLATAEHTWFSAHDLDPESLVFAQAAFQHDRGRQGRFALGVEYVFQDTVFDVSPTEAELTTVAATGHTLAARPGFGVELNPVLRADLEFELIRQLYSEPLDDDWEAGARLTLKWTPTRLAALTLSGRLRERSYDTRTALDADGFPLGDGLVMHAAELETEWRQDWDEARRWRTQLRLSLGRLRDNGGGYFDFNRYGARAAVRYEAAPWSLRAEARVWHFDYPTQTVAGSGTRLRRILEVTTTARAEYALGGGWSTYLEYTREESDDNAPDADYVVNTGMLGFQYTF